MIEAGRIAFAARNNVCEPENSRYVSLMSSDLPIPKIRSKRVADPISGIDREFCTSFKPVLEITSKPKFTLLKKKIKTIPLRIAPMLISQNKK
jgi:hypothetical protein